MPKKLLQIILILLFSNSIFSQQTNDTKVKENSNPIIYLEGFGGPSVVKNFGVSGGVELNYQFETSLFTLRYINSAGYSRKNDGPVIIAPSVYKSEDNVEYALMYGKRWLSVSHSYSISAGISRNNIKIESRTDNLNDEEVIRTVTRTGFCGFPFEANYKWFYAKKRSKLVYNALIPSVGIKLFGEIGKYSFGGIGITLGLGLSKRY